jgi:hypothetical protein
VWRPFHNTPSFPSSAGDLDRMLALRVFIEEFLADSTRPTFAAFPSKG